MAYDAETLPDLEPCIRRGYPDSGEVEAWAKRFVTSRRRIDIAHLLARMTAAIHQDFAYSLRLEAGTKTPVETLSSRTGTCRDFALLMMEAARSLGLAARFVTGYIYVSAQDAAEHRGGGATHAWVQVFLPGAGWVEFDPTNGIVGNRDLIRVGVARDPYQALPLHGTYGGRARDFVGMTVDVQVTKVALARSSSKSPFPSLREDLMQINAGFKLTYDVPKPTPMLLTLSIHPSRHGDLLTPQVLNYDPPVQTWDYTDGFGNICTRLTAPAGRMTISTSFEIYDTGQPDVVARDALQHDIRDLPDDVLVFLLGSRYCETDRLSNIAWTLFEYTEPGWPRVQAILDWVHNHIRFDYTLADSTRTAHGAYIGQVGVCRDYTHLAIAFCRCMNIPARYCTGYLGDIGNVPVPGPMDFSAWLQVYLGGHWYTVDARNNTPRIGRILMAMGRDATDVALSTQFGPASLVGFEVVTEEVMSSALAQPAA